MKIEMLYFEGCPNTEPARRLLREVLAEQDVEAFVKEINITTEEEAQRFQFLGSPSIRVDGTDVEGRAGISQDYGLRCRLYRHNGAAQGYPSKDMIRAAIQSARDVQGRGASDCCTFHPSVGQQPAARSTSA